MAFTISLIITCGLAFLYVLCTVGHRSRHLPPGPPTLPLIGNLHQLPTNKIFLQLDAWSKVYGPIYSIKLGPKTMIVLSDRHLARQVLDKRSATSSDRPATYIVQEIVTGGDHLLWMDNTPEWKLMRRMIHQDFTEKKCVSDHSILQDAESAQMLYDIVQKPEQWKQHLARFTNSVIMSIVYGIRNPCINDEWSKRFQKLLASWADIAEIGATPPIDIFPFLAWLPQSWFKNWKTRARAVHDELHALYGSMQASVVERRSQQGSLDSIMDRLLENEAGNGLTKHQITLLSGVTIKGGSDTTVTVLSSLIQALVTWPEIQKKCQNEIDSIVDETRLPNLNDVKSLPYIVATIKEAHRWRGLGGTGMPRRLSEDEIVNGYVLPKGSTVILNTWGLHHDESRFPDPDKFDPEHYKNFDLLAAEYANHADPNTRDHYGYGNGRRICPGIHLAERNLFFVVSRLLWAFDIKAPVDANGKSFCPDISVETGYRDGLTISPTPFSVTLTPRSPVRTRVIQKAYLDAKTDVFPKYEEKNLVNKVV